MDIEKLTKSQIVLLTLLVSFVTSIATGIVTVSLMQQAPPAIAETVNRVIEHTIQIVATSTKQQAAAAVVTQEKTVIVNQADEIVQAVKQVAPSVVKIYTDDAEQPAFLGLGVVLDASGTVAADIGALGDRPDAVLEMQDGTRMRTFVTSRTPSSGLLFLTPATTTAATVSWTPAKLGAEATLGQTVVTLSGKGTLQLAPGLVTQIIPADPATNIPATIVTSINADAIQAGSVVIDTSGNVIGVSTGISRASSPSGFVPAASLNKREQDK